MNQLSLIVLTHNSELALQRINRHYAWTDDIVIVDYESTDNTIQVAKSFGYSIIQSTNASFAERRMLGAKGAKFNWLLYIDTDEIVTTKGIAEIHQIVQKDPGFHPHGYTLPRVNYFFFERWPHDDGMIRLIFKPSLKRWYGDVHETCEIDGPIGTLHEPCLHITHTDISSMVEKTNKWSEIEAELRITHHHPPMANWRFLRVMATEWKKYFIQQRGYIIGRIGLLESLYQAFSIGITYVKVWEKQQRTSI